MRRVYLLSALTVALAASARPTAAQGVVNEALAGFPPQTFRVEYSSPAKLRKLPNYQNLRQRYIGPRLQTLESSLGQLGIRDEDIDEMMLGWQSGQTEMDFYGFASGRFDPRGIADRAAAAGMSPTPVAEQPAYCLQGGLAGTCIAVLENNLGAFGALTSLTAMLEARARPGAGLGADNRFAPLLGEVNKDAGIWGVAVGAAVGDWFRGWVPNQGNLKLDWGKVFEKVNSLVYSIQAGDKVNLDVKLDCATSDDAAGVRQLLEGLKLAQQLAWQAQNPSRANPFQAMAINQQSRQVTLQVTTGYSDLELAGGLGAPEF
jgi:hypothetical protein